MTQEDSKGNPAQPELQDPLESERRRLGALVKLLRWEQGWTRRKLGQEVGLADSGIRRLEAGRYIMTRVQWERLLAALPGLAAQVVALEIRVELVDPSS